jgi:hypothetical protein
LEASAKSGGVEELLRQVTASVLSQHSERGTGRCKRGRIQVHKDTRFEPERLHLYKSQRHVLVELTTLCSQNSFRRLLKLAEFFAWKCFVFNGLLRLMARANRFRRHLLGAGATLLQCSVDGVLYEQ